MGTMKNTLNEKEMELVKYLVTDCRTTGDIQEIGTRLWYKPIDFFSTSYPDFQHVLYFKLQHQKFRALDD